MKYVLLFVLMSWTAFAADKVLDVTADKLEIEQDGGQAVFMGNVRAVRGGLTLIADRANVFFGEGKGEGDIKEVVATGNVLITKAGSPPETARGDKAVYAPAAGTLVLTGAAVVLARGGHAVQGNRLDYDVASGKATMQSSGGGVRARFQSGGQ